MTSDRTDDAHALATLATWSTSRSRHGSCFREGVRSGADNKWVMRTQCASVWPLKLEHRDRSCSCRACQSRGSLDCGLLQSSLEFVRVCTGVLLLAAYCRPKNYYGGNNQPRRDRGGGGAYTLSSCAGFKQRNDVRGFTKHMRASSHACVVAGVRALETR